MGKIECIVCSKRCRGTVLKIGDYHLHKKCFNCKKCGVALDVKTFQLRDKEFFCPVDFRKEFNTKCCGCGNPVEGDVVTALGKTFHTFCLRCFSCNQAIPAGQKTVCDHDRFYCETCAPPQINRDDSVQSFPTDRSPHGQTWITPLIAHQDPEAIITCTTNGQETKPRAPKSSSLPRKLGSFLRGKKSKSQTLPHPDTKTPPAQHKSSQLQPAGVNGTEPLTINVGETDGSTADRGHAKTFEPKQSPSFSLYSGVEDGTCKTREKRATLDTTTDNYPIPRSVSGTGGVPYSIDAAFTTPSMIHTLSEDASTLLYGSVRRICPPGVDYGRQYLVSYLRLAEQGLTAVTGTDHQSEATIPSSLASLRHLPPSGPASQRLSRRDILSQQQQKQQTRTLPASMETGSSRPMSSYADRRYAAQMFGEMAGGRPEKDRYSRYRQMSPAASSMVRAISSGRGTMPGANFVSRRPQTYSSFSTPNVNSKRAESMLRSPRTGRSTSPEAALEAHAEARRLAAYPSARVPDANSEPAIDRYDWPAPPSPAVVMIDRRRERAMRSGTLADGTVPRSDGSGSDTRTLSPGRTHSMSPMEPERPHNGEQQRHLEEKITTLKRATGNSGMSAAVVQYLEEEARQRDTSPDLDPISASRSPNANVEPPYHTRYASHRFASPSRSTLRRTYPAHFVAGTYTGSVSAIPPRPGYTSGILSSRPGSLPRGVNGALPSQDWSLASPLSPAQRKINAHAGNTRTLPINGLRGPIIGHDAERDGFYSLATSGLSMDGLGGPSSILPSTYQARTTTLTGGLPPPAISGLRPVSRGYNYYTGPSTRSRNLTNSSILRNGCRNPRTLSEGSRGLDSPLIEEPSRRANDQYPHVQNWLKPTKSLPGQEDLKYTYDQLKLSAKEQLKGIDGNQREAYLSMEEFERLFQMSRSAFRLLPEWKKNDLKRRLDLY